LPADGAWLAWAGCGDHVHVAARSLVPVGADEPLRLGAALVGAHVHDHAARIEVFAGAPHNPSHDDKQVEQPGYCRGGQDPRPVLSSPTVTL
jgi:hypothetical protein